MITRLFFSNGHYNLLLNIIINPSNDNLFDSDKKNFAILSHYKKLVFKNQLI